MERSQGQLQKGLAHLSPIPLYYQIVKVLQARILSGLYPPGSQIETEAALAEAFGVSRLTIRNAMAVLQEQGLLERHRARGTFVAQKVKRQAIAQLHGFVEDVILLGDFGRTLWMDCDEVAIEAAEADKLGVAPGSQVVRVRRLRATGSPDPEGWVINYLPLDVGRALDLQRLQTESLIHLLNEMPDVQLSDGFQTISAAQADGEIAERLDIALGSPVLLVERLLQTASGRPVDLARFYQRGDRITYSVRLTRIWR